MSVRVMSWVLQHSKSRLGDRLVLIAIADNAASSGGDAWPSIGEISVKAGMSERNVYNAIESLQKIGELRVEKKLVNKRWRNCYTIVMTPEDSSSHLPEERSPEESSAENHDTAPLKNLQPTPENSAGPMYKEEPSKEPSKEPSMGAELAIRHDQPTAQTIVGEWIDRCRKRPPKNVIGQMSKHIAAMLAEGIDPDDIRRGIAAWMTKDLHPSTLPSIVNSVMNTNGRSTTNDRVSQALALAEKYAREGQ